MLRPNKLCWFRVLLLVLGFIGICIPSKTQTTTIDGYRGIWFGLGQHSAYGDKYSGGLGTYTSSHIPIAIFSEKARKTFFVYGGTTDTSSKHLLIMISYFDHKTKTVPKPVVVYDKNGVDDPHDNASLSIDDSGYIWVFVSGRNTRRLGIIFKSLKPYQIDGFEKIREADMTYPQPWWVKGKGFLYLFTKYTKGRELYWSSSTDGKKWEPDQKLAGMGGHYQVSNAFNGKITSVFNFHPGGNVDKRTNLYLLQTDDMGKSWKTIDGQVIEVPLSSKITQAIVKDYEQEGSLVYINDLNFDREGNPVILVVISKGFQPGPAGDPREWTILHWKNNQWNSRVLTSSSHNYDMGSLYIEGNRWIVVGPTAKGPQALGTGGEMERWESANEGKSWTKKTLTSGSSRNHSYARRPMNVHPEFYAFWADGNADRFSRSVLYFSNKKGDLWQLPADMKSNFQKPEKLKRKRLNPAR